MPEETTTPLLSERFDEALKYASDLHRTQTRKGGDIPYVGHLLSAASLVIEGGGDETQAIAALLHDAVEDRAARPGSRRSGRSSATTSPRSSMSAAIPTRCPSRRGTSARRNTSSTSGYVSEATILVSLADKVDNARAILRDHERVGDELWQRFSVKDPDKHLCYYKSLLAVYKRRNKTWLVDELARVVETLEKRIKKPTGG